MNPSVSSPDTGRLLFTDQIAARISFRNASCPARLLRMVNLALRRNCTSSPHMFSTSIGQYATFGAG